MNVHTDTVLMHTTLSHGQVPGNHGQEIESVIAEMMSGQGHDGVKILLGRRKGLLISFKANVSRERRLSSAEERGEGLR